MNGYQVLDGMRIVEASAFVAAPLGGMTLAQMGADVIRIDPIGGGLDYRRWPVTPDGTSLFWCGLNKGKRSVAIDIASPEGREISCAIATSPGEGGGIVLTNMPARGWLDHDYLRSLRPDLVQLTFQGTRDGGSAVDYTINPRMGLPLITGSAKSGGVVNHVLPVWDLISGQMLALGLMAADRARSRTGKGQHVKLSLEDVALSVMSHLGFIAEAQLGQERGRYGNYLFGAFGRDFACRDGQRIMVVGLTSKQWRSLCAATELTVAIELLEARLGCDLSLEGKRFAAREEIAQLLIPWFGVRDFSEVCETFDRHGVCWGRYQSIQQLVHEDPSCSVQNPMFSMVDQPGVGRVISSGIPFDFNGNERRSTAPAPTLGEHTEEVLSELLGIDQSAFSRLLDRGVVATASRP